MIMLSEKQCSLIEKALTEDAETRKVAAYLCLHMGLTIAEITALRFEDIDLDAGNIVLHNIIGQPEGTESKNTDIISLEIPRVLPIPPHVRRYLSRNSRLYNSEKCFIITGSQEKPEPYHIQNILSSICGRYKIADKLSATDLRNAFICRCIQSGVDLYSLCNYIGIKQPNVIVRKFGEYFESKPNAVDVLEKYSADYTPAQTPQDAEFTGPKNMNLLILGAGSQGPVVKEIAEAIGIFKKIAFLDDDPNNKLAMDTCENYEKYINEYPIAIPSFGDSYLREKWITRLENHGYILPNLIHPSATVSPSAKLDTGIVIEAKCIVSAGAIISKGAIISSGSIIEVMARVEEFSHVGSAATVAKSAVVPKYMRVGSGTVVRVE